MEQNQKMAKSDNKKKRKFFDYIVENWRFSLLPSAAAI
jgi:hypothetical protein